MPNQWFRKIGIIPWMPLFGLLLLFLCFSALASELSLVLNTAHVYPLSSPEGSGFEDKILKEAFRRIGKEIKIIHLPSERALINANEGTDDGNFARVAGLEKTYPNLIRVPERLWMFEFAVFS
jgi:polar amino acid transport system substrate-binding protein